MESYGLLCYLIDMKPWLTICRLLAAFAVLGLLMAPFAAPARATTLPRVVNMISHRYVSTPADSEMAMPAGMPCCPEKAPTSDCSKDCPLSALCLSGIVFNVPTGVALLLPVGQTSLPFPQSDTVLTSLGYGPPPKPPKT